MWIIYYRSSWKGCGDTLSETTPFAVFWTSYYISSKKLCLSPLTDTKLLMVALLKMYTMCPLTRRNAIISFEIYLDFIYWTRNPRQWTHPKMFLLFKMNEKFPLIISMIKIMWCLRTEKTRLFPSITITIWVALALIVLTTRSQKCKTTTCPWTREDTTMETYLPSHEEMTTLRPLECWGNTVV